MTSTFFLCMWVSLCVALGCSRTCAENLRLYHLDTITLSPANPLARIKSMFERPRDQSLIRNKLVARPSSSHSCYEFQPFHRYEKRIETFIPYYTNSRKAHYRLLPALPVELLRLKHDSQNVFYICQSEAGRLSGASPGWSSSNNTYAARARPIRDGTREEKVIVLRHRFMGHTHTLATRENCHTHSIYV
jgi:hypothetical protein